MCSPSVLGHNPATCACRCHVMCKHPLTHVHCCNTGSQVLEFVAFKERLEHAHTFALARAETAVHSISSAASSRTYEEACAAVTDACAGVSAAASSSPAWDALRFNQDFATRPAWLPPCGASAQLGVMAWWEQARSSTSDGLARWVRCDRRKQAQKDHTCRHVGLFRCPLMHFTVTHM